VFETLRLRLGADWLTELQAETRAFGRQHRDELDDATRTCTFPEALYREMGKRGWVGPTTPSDEGGLGGGVAEYCAVCEEVAKNGLVSPQISVQGQQWLLTWGSPEQRARYLAGIARGEVIFAEAISEPGAASSLRALTAVAKPDGDEFVLTGRKTHVNLGAQADVVLVYASVPGSGLTAFFVDTPADGLVCRQTDPIGLRMLPTAEMDFTEVRVPRASVLGEVGRGFDTFLTTFNVSRLGNASELIGFGERALANSIIYARNRPVGDNTVADFQGIQWIVADAYSKLYAASLARDTAANAADQAQDVSLRTTVAKKLAIEAAEFTINECFSLVGSHGLYTDTDYGQLLADLKVYRVAGGSLDILRNYLARRVLGSESFEGLLAETTTDD